MLSKDYDIERFEDVENIHPDNMEDRETFIAKSLNNLKLDYSTDTSSKIIETLIQERLHWQTQFSSSSEECQKLRQQISMLTRERDRELDSNNGLRYDQQLLNNRITTLNNEHRDIRNRWLSEKSDLEGRLFQLQALNTQVQGTMKKKEKDFEKLQTQLSKIVKDSMRSLKPPALMISVPLKKNISQQDSIIDKAALEVLRDAEVLAAKTSMKCFEAENQSLRRSIEQMQVTVIEIEADFKKSLEAAEDNYHQLLAVATTSSSTGAVSVANTPSHILSATTPTHAGNLAKKYLEGTPGARPVSWVVEQVNTEVKRLRDRAEQIRRLDPTSPCPAAGEPIPSLRRLQVQLSEAMIVISEQVTSHHTTLFNCNYYIPSHPIL